MRIISNTPEALEFRINVTWEVMVFCLMAAFIFMGFMNSGATFIVEKREDGVSNASYAFHCFGLDWGKRHAMKLEQVNLITTPNAHLIKIQIQATEGGFTKRVWLGTDLSDTFLGAVVSEIYQPFVDRSNALISGTTPGRIAFGGGLRRMPGIVVGALMFFLLMWKINRIASGRVDLVKKEFVLKTSNNSFFPDHELPLNQTMHFHGEISTLDLIHYVFTRKTDRIGQALVIV